MIILAVEATDLVFALDSIPAVLAITRDPFIAYTSNIFAVLGLRSLFFALSGMLDRFRLLHYGLGVILAFVAMKMLLSRWVHVNVGISLGSYSDDSGDLHCGFADRRAEAEKRQRSLRNCDQVLLPAAPPNGEQTAHRPASENHCENERRGFLHVLKPIPRSGCR